MDKIAIIVGTRPEIIKTAPVIEAIKAQARLVPYIIFTGQHDSMAEQAFNAFNISPDVNLSLMKENQSPNQLLGELLPALEKLLIQVRPLGVIVQGDTTSALGGALASFHLKIPLAHIEAGLRTFDFSSPFPEEMNRVLISKLSNLHFCPTLSAQNNLIKEGYKENIFVVGNTVVDALEKMKNIPPTDNQVKELISSTNKILLVTGHRRENFDRPLKNLCQCLVKLGEVISDLSIIYPVHLNPEVQKVANQELVNRKNIFLLPPVDYPSLLALIKQSSLIITDSGGIQEEAPSFGVRVLITRKFTERAEAVEAGCAEIVSLDNSEDIFNRALAELISPSLFPRTKKNPFGDGQAAKRIVEIIEKTWLKK